MNNNIEEGYCSEKVIQLLQEKGCKITQRIITTFPHPTDKNNALQSDEHTISHALAIEWIRVNFKINIWVRFWRGGYKYETELIRSSELYDTPQEATEAALLYTLTNLI